MTKANISWNAKQIAKAVELGSMTFNNAIQRREVWDISRKSLFVDSLLRNYPIPAMYTIRTDIDAPEGCKKGSKVFDCIDGKQRGTTIKQFRNNEFALVGLELLDGEDINGKTYAELTEEQRDTFDSYTMTVYFFTDITDEEICEMMSRLNNGKPLTGIEDARIKAKNLPAIAKLASHSFFTENLSVSAMRSYHNEDIVIKTALQMFQNVYELSTKNVKNAYESLPFTKEQVASLTNVLDIAYHALTVMRENAKKSVVAKATKKTSLVNVLSLVFQSGSEDWDSLGNFLSSFFNEEDVSTQEERKIFYEAYTDGTNHENKVVLRNKAILQAYIKSRE